VTPISGSIAALAVGWTASVLSIQLRGRERLSFMRQLTDHSTFLAPYNVFVYVFSAVPNRPRLDASAFPELDRLTAQWETIRDEAIGLWRAGRIRATDRHDDLAFNSFFKRDWSRFYLRWYGDFLPSACALAPRTVAIVREVPTVRAAMFALLPPARHLVRHRDPFAGSLRYHLGLATANGDACRILIDGEPYHWRDGEAVLFDPTFVHRAENRSAGDRLILFCDVERPLRTRTATTINRFVIERLMPASAARNVESDPLGMLNRLFQRVYGVRLFAKRLKRRSRRTYYVLSYAFKLAPLAALVWLALR
jgi:beta-hydroxylase